VATNYIPKFARETWLRLLPSQALKNQPQGRSAGTLTLPGIALQFSENCALNGTLGAIRLPQVDAQVRSRA
jgi:hypothetical protein